MSEPWSPGRLVEIAVLKGGQQGLAECEVCGAAILVALRGDSDPGASYKQHMHWHHGLLRELIAAAERP